MTLDSAQRLDRFDTFERVLGKRMEKVMIQSTEGEVNWDHDTWSALLDWIQGPLRRRIYTSWMERNPGMHLEQNPAYEAFEGFDRARIEGILDDHMMVKVCFALVKEMIGLEKDGLEYFEVKFKPPKSELEKRLESRGT